ncbi:DUF6799 domain-containing protein [Kaistella palustris]|uniref:DUF6799 domain-containing protein n=1 Tax=Kaistella palustris TaxID=493376 RepID=UPI0004814121|nr:DUF6799 domain-containing protein [Kaistella palustris]
MKKSVIAIIAVVAMSSCNSHSALLGSPAPSPPPPAPNREIMMSPTPTGTEAGRGVLMRNGSLYTVSDGNMTPLKEDITFENGDKLKADGRIIHRDGTVTKMTEGMMINNNGDISKNGASGNSR